MTKHNIALYPTEEELFLRALDAESGIKIKASTPEGATKQWATNFSHRMNKCREADRQRSLTIYDPGHAKHGKSDFDSLIVRKHFDAEAQGWYLTITRREEDIGSFEIEDL